MQESVLFDTSAELAEFCAKAADNKLAQDILILDLKEIEFAPADYFVICSCDSDTQVDAVVSSIERETKGRSNRPKVEGKLAKEWVLIDYFDVVVHVMLKKSREYYKLEKLWGDAGFRYIDSRGEIREMSEEQLDELIRVNV